MNPDQPAFDLAGGVSFFVPSHLSMWRAILALTIVEWQIGHTTIALADSAEKRGA